MTTCPARRKAAKVANASKKRSPKKAETSTDGYTQEIHDAILERLALGRSLLSISKDEDMPSHATILRWRKKYPELDEAIPRAREEGTHTLADECLQIADNKDLEPADRRVRIDTRLRLIGKWNARHYGDKLEVEQRVFNVTIDGDDKAL